jgi:hypothetical protein
MSDTDTIKLYLREFEGDIAGKELYCEWITLPTNNSQSSYRRRILSKGEAYLAL